MHRIPKGFEQYKQFINWKPVPRPDGKTDKIPVSPSGYNIDSQNPENWLTATDAIATGLDIAFVFTVNDPFFFIDVDNCHDGIQWSAEATRLVTEFAGACVEVSQSGVGLHIFGSGVVTNDRRCKSIDGTFDLYTEGRFVALSNNGCNGDATTRHDMALAAMVGKYLPPSVDTENGPGWTNEPIPEYTGPDDDENLIHAMIRTKSAGVFDGRASVKDLWEGNDPILAQCYPPDQGGPGFDHSAADAALCQHLAFWTGKNCERMDRLMRKSALMRDKWVQRQQYRENTILKACGLCNKVYDKPRPDVSVERDVIEPTARVGDGFLLPSEQTELFKGCVYVRDIHKVFIPSGGLLKSDQFRVMYGGYTFSMDNINSKTTKSAWEVFTESQAVNFPKAHKTCFRPELPVGKIVNEDGDTMVNTYVQIETRRVVGDPSPFINVLEKMIPNEQDRKILMSYIAACVQYPGVKFQWCPVIQGAEGNGKSLIGRCLAAAIGHKYTHLPNAKELGGKFNGWLVNKLLAVVEEVRVNGKMEVMDALKPMITNDRIEIESKGVDQTTGDNRANFIMNSNFKDAVIKNKNDRRYAIFYCAQQTVEDIARDGMTGNYFPNLYKWLRADGYAIVNNYLRSYQIPDELNPATNCHRAPITTSTDEAVEASLGGIEQAIKECIAEGRRGFCGGWVSSLALNKLIEYRRDEKRVPHRLRKEIMGNIGYIWHPNLKNGRINNPISTEGGKPILYIKKGHISCNLQSCAEIVQSYMSAQTESVFAENETNNMEVG